MLTVFVLFFIIGVFLTVFGFLGLLSGVFLTISFVLSILLVCMGCYAFILRIKSLDRFETVIFYLLSVILVLHFIQVLVPETGFDALWYHLPVAKEILAREGIVYMSEIYQTLNPLFSDLYFVAGYSVLGETGSKLVAYLFMLLLLQATYLLSRSFLNRKFSLLVVLCVSTFQVVAWQSASFYVDVAKGFWEIAGLWIVTTNHPNRVKYAALFFSASLATKLFSLLLLPIFIYSFVQGTVVVGIVYLLLLPCMYYLFSYWHTGDPFYVLSLVLKNLDQIGGTTSFFTFAIKRTVQVIVSPYYFTTARDYVFPLLTPLGAVFLFAFNKVWKTERLRILLLFSVLSWLIWWFVPPLSTRYALSGFVTLLICVVYGVQKYVVKSTRHEQVLVALLLISVLVNAVPRIFVAKRSLTYLFGGQTQQQYLEQFYDGSIDDKIKSWYRLQ